MAQPTDRWMILIAGPVRSGKSTLAKRIAEQFGGMRVGFGDAIRRRAQALGLPDERTFLQQVGQEWVNKDPGGLCDTVLAPSTGEALVVVDGVRHRQVHSLLRARAQDRHVMTVFVDAEVRVRRDRLALDGISEEASDRVLNHSTEKELPWLRGTADILVDGTKDTTPTPGRQLGRPRMTRLRALSPRRTGLRAAEGGPCRDQGDGLSRPDRRR